MSERIGILTVHKNTNYGANLQAYALCRYINSIGYDCEIVDYVPDDRANHLLSWLKLSWDGEKNKSLKRKIKLFIALGLSIVRKSRRLHNFYKFRKGYMKLSTTCRDSNDIKYLDYDILICGSDQVWNPNITNGIDPVFFGDIDNVKKRISYAASIGKSRYEDSDERLVASLVKKMDYVSLREEETAEYISRICNINAVCVCDPVFLLGKEDYLKILGERPLIKRKYVLLYSIVSNDELSNIAEQYAKELGIILIEICADKTKNCRHQQITHFGPVEFLNLFRYAETIFTNSFHGTAFSIIFEKNFYVVDNQYGGSRIVNLMDKADLSSRIISNYNDINHDVINYTDIKLHLQDYVSNSKNFIFKAVSAEKKQLLGEACVGCGVCKAVCKFDAIRLLNDFKGFTYAYVDLQKCVKCGKCNRVCPVEGKVNFESDDQSIFAYKAPNELRKNSASGGAFAELATSILSDNGVVYGASMQEGFSVKHIRCDSIDNLHELQGTKYVQSDLNSCFVAVKKDLIDNREVLFSGTPCQVYALKKYLQSEKIDFKNLILVDIICHGVPSPDFFKNFIIWLGEKYKSRVKQYNFRSKKISWRGDSCTAELETGKQLSNDRKVSSYMNVYYSGNITRECCFDCKFTNTKRVSDITISDYWGIENFASEFEDKLGVSMIIINSAKGEELLNKVDGQKMVGNLDAAKQSQLYKPCTKPDKHKEFWELYKKKGIGECLNSYGGFDGVLKYRIKSFFKKIIKM